jgi:PKD repeat protein
MIPLSTSFTFTPSSPDAGQSVSFTGSASGGTSPYGYSWNFGDGGTGSGSLVKHTYQSSGTYTVGLTVTDSGGQVAAASKTITVNARPSASFTYGPSNPLPLQSITFMASATGGLQPYTYSWDFGDGSTGTGPSASHSYTLPGTYTVTLTVTDANAQTFTTSKTITVLASL